MKILFVIFVTSLLVIGSVFAAEGPSDEEWGSDSGDQAFKAWAMYQLPPSPKPQESPWSMRLRRVFNTLDQELDDLASNPSEAFALLDGIDGPGRPRLPRLEHGPGNYTPTELIEILNHWSENEGCEGLEALLYPNL